MSSRNFIVAVPKFLRAELKKLLRRFPLSVRAISTKIKLTKKYQYERLNGVNRQPSNGQKINRQPSKKAVVISRQTVSRSFKSHYFSCSSRTAGSQRIVLTGTTSFHVPKNTHFTVFSTHLRLN